MTCMGYGSRMWEAEEDGWPITDMVDLLTPSLGEGPTDSGARNAGKAAW